MSERELLDDEGENLAVRSFLMVYGGANAVSVGQMRKHMEMSGWPGYWPGWVATEHAAAHLSKAGAQLWLRYLFGKEAS
jgi:hypothetical protein